MSSPRPKPASGHVHLRVADLERAIDFYTRVLGFELVTVMALRPPSSRLALSTINRPQHLGKQRRHPPPRGIPGFTTRPFSTPTARRWPRRCAALSMPASRCRARPTMALAKRSTSTIPMATGRNLPRPPGIRMAAQPRRQLAHVQRPARPAQNS